MKSNRLLFNIVWLITLLIITFVYLYFLPFPSGDPPEYLRLIIGLGPPLIIQTFLHYIVLNRRFSLMKRTNLYWVVAMPFLFLICIGIITIVILAIAFRSATWPT